MPTNTPTPAQELKQISKYAVSSEAFRLAVSSAFNHVILTDVDGQIIYANSAAEKLTGYTFEEMKGNTPRLWGRQMPKEVYEELWRTIKVEQKPFTGEFKNKRRDGVFYDAKAIVSPIFDKNKSLIGFIGTEEDITLVKNVDRMKSEFISIAAHQLKTPLTGLRWSLENLREALGEKVANKEEFETSLEIVDALNKIVTDLLNISRIESGRLKIEAKEIDLVELINTQIEHMNSVRAMKNQTISFESEKKSLKLKVDPKLISEVLKNLLSNALKYSGENTEVVVGLVSDGTNITIAVSDKGRGIPKKNQNQIFQKFFRADNTSGIEGTGLGLYFIKSIIDVAGGQMWFESEEDVGTTFYFTLPLVGMESHEGEVGLS